MKNISRHIVRKLPNSYLSFIIYGYGYFTKIKKLQADLEDCSRGDFEIYSDCNNMNSNTIFIDKLIPSNGINVLSDSVIKVTIRKFLLRKRVKRFYTSCTASAPAGEVVYEMETSKRIQAV
jgi:hypothetical protein